MKFDGNFPIVPDDQDIIGGDNGKSGFVKTEQFYYFNKNKINYRVIGYIQPDIFELIIDYINGLQIPIKRITENL